MIRARLARLSGPPLSDRIAPRNAERAALGLLAVLFVVLVVSRVSGLAQSLWHDEVFAAVHYVRPGPAGIWFGEYEPNNHVLFNLLAWLTTSVAGMGEVVLRLWSVVPGIAAVAILVWWCWCRLGHWVAVVVAFLATTAPLYLYIHPQARGYGLMALAAVVMLIVADRLLHREHGGVRNWLAFGGASLLGIGTHLAFALGFVAQSAALLAFRRLRLGVVLTGVCVAVASAALYGPLFGPLVSDLPKYYGGSSSSSATDPQAGVPAREPLPWHAPVTGPATLAAPAAEVLVRGTDYRPCGAGCYDGIKLILVLPLLLAWAAGIAALWFDGRRRLLLVLAVPPVLSFLALTLQNGYVAARFVSYTIPPTLVLISLGILAIVERLSTIRRLRPAVLAGAGLLAAAMLFQFAQVASWWSIRPFEDMRAVASVVDREGEGRVVTNSQRPDGLFYYLGEDRVEVENPRRLRRTLCREPGPFVFIFHPYLAKPLDLTCLGQRGPRSVTVRQRDRGGRVDVFFVEDRSLRHHARDRD